MNCGLLNTEVLFSRSQNHGQSEEWLGGKESEYISPDLVIVFMHLEVIGLAQFLVASFALDVRGSGACYVLFMYVARADLANILGTEISSVYTMLWGAV